MRVTVASGLLSAICAPLVFLGCAGDPSTQLVVLMDTDYAVPGEVDRIRARVSKIVEKDAGPEEVETWRNEFSVSEDAAVALGLPATFGILPGGDDLDKEIVIELEALSSETGQPLVSRRIKTGFVPGEARLVRMLLYRACADMVCSMGEACGCSAASVCAEPSCVDEVVGPQDLERIDNPGLLPADAGIPIHDAGLPDGGVINCQAPLMLCGMDCVNPQANPRYCGDCETACPIGNVCDAGRCTDPGDCRTNGVGCSGFTYCEESSGDCLPGCSEAEQCSGEHEVCDTDAHQCVCASDFERCDGACVNTDIDPSYCGDCTISCPDRHVCDRGMCLDPGDCRNNGIGCVGFTYCDEATGECVRGCGEDEQCVGENEACDTVKHECDCAAGFHRCGSVCVSDLDVSSCGALCTPCPAPANGRATCVLGSCEFVCDETYEPCDQMCCLASCPPGQALYLGTCAKIHVQIANQIGNTGEYSSLALDAAGRAHIAYYASSGRDLAYSAQQLDDTWLSEKPDSDDEVGRHASIAFDGQGLPHIAYYNASTKDLMLASKQIAGDWTVETVDSKGDVGEYTSLAFDADGSIHISYYNASDKDLMYATRQGTAAWSTRVVDDEDDVGEFTSLAIDRAGAVHISYYDADGKDLKHATRQMDDSWRTQTVASFGDVGKYSSLAFDDDGVAHISYYREDDKDLLYASAVFAGLWTSQIVEGLPNVGKYTSLAFDEGGVARISYYDESARNLKYAVQLSNGTWSIEVVDSVGDVGRYTSIAVDDLGQAHVGYYDATNSNLKYALIAAPE